VKLLAYRKQRGILYRSAWERFRKRGIPAAYLESGRVQVPDRAAARCIPSLAALYGLRSAKRRTTQVREILTRPLPDLGEPGQPAARAEQ
jgi:hypothetical protein